MNKNTAIKLSLSAIAILITINICYKQTMVAIWESQPDRSLLMVIIIVAMSHYLGKTYKKLKTSDLTDKLLFYFVGFGILIPMALLYFKGRESLWNGGISYFLISIFVLVGGFANTYHNYIETFSKNNDEVNQNK